MVSVELDFLKDMRSLLKDCPLTSAAPSLTRTSSRRVRRSLVLANFRHGPSLRSSPLLSYSPFDSVTLTEYHTSSTRYWPSPRAAKLRRNESGKNEKHSQILRCYAKVCEWYDKRVGVVTMGKKAQKILQLDPNPRRQKARPAASLRVEHALRSALRLLLEAAAPPRLPRMLTREGEIPEQPSIALLVVDALSLTPSSTGVTPAPTVRKHPFARPTKIMVIAGVLVGVRWGFPRRRNLTGGETGPVDGGEEGVTFDVFGVDSFGGVACEELWRYQQVSAAVCCSASLAHLEKEVSTLRRVALAHGNLDLATEDALVLLDLTFGICGSVGRGEVSFLFGSEPRSMGTHRTDSSRSTSRTVARRATTSRSCSRIRRREGPRGR